MLYHTLNYTLLHSGDYFVAGSTTGCRYDSFLCGQWGMSTYSNRRPPRPCVVVFNILSCIKTPVIRFICILENVYLRPSNSNNTPVRLSVRLWHLFHNPATASSWHFQELLPLKGQGQKSNVKVTEVKKMPQFGRFRTVTTVWIHIWLWNEIQSLT